MAELTPLQRLDDAVHDYFDAIGREDGEGGTLGGWTLAYQFSWIENNGDDVDPVIWGAGYSISPGFSPFAADGCLAHVRRVIGDTYSNAADEDEQE